MESLFWNFLQMLEGTVILFCIVGTLMVNVFTRRFRFNLHYMFPIKRVSGQL